MSSRAKQINYKQKNPNSIKQLTNTKTQKSLLEGDFGSIIAIFGLF